MNSPTLKHIAIICDGNRRWAKDKGLNPMEGHKYAFEKTFMNLIDEADRLKLECITFWIFSTENWDRSDEEINWLMNLFRIGFAKINKKANKNNYKVIHLGNIDKLAKDIQKSLRKLTESTKNNTGLTVCLAANYGGHDEIIRAIKKMHKEGFDINKLDEKNFEQFLDTRGLPNPDLIIRTSGEFRLSGFLSWQSQYSEFYFPETKFPDFNGDELEKAIKEFNKRQRRYGK